MDDVSVIETLKTMLPKSFEFFTFDRTANVTVLSQVLAFFAAVVGAVVAFVFLWWGVRKLVRVAMAAIRKGRMSI